MYKNTAITIAENPNAYNNQAIREFNAPKISQPARVPPIAIQIPATTIPATIVTIVNGMCLYKHQSLNLEKRLGLVVL